MGDQEPKGMGGPEEKDVKLTKSFLKTLAEHPDSIYVLSLIYFNLEDGKVNLVDLELSKTEWTNLKLKTVSAWADDCLQEMNERKKNYLKIEPKFLELANKIASEMTPNKDNTNGPTENDISKLLIKIETLKRASVLLRVMKMISDLTSSRANITKATYSADDAEWLRETVKKWNIHHLELGVPQKVLEYWMYKFN